MNFLPIEDVGISSSSLADIDIDVYEKNIHGSSNSQKYNNIFKTIIIIIISAIIFVMIVSIYDVIRNVVSNIYAKKTLRDPTLKFTKIEIKRTLKTNKNALIASVIFAVICIIIALIFIPLLVNLII